MNMRNISPDFVRLRDIMEAIENVESCSLHMESHKKDIHAACYNIAIIGEASRHVSDTIKAENAMIPWREIVNMRNVILHEYSKVDMQSLLDAVEDDLPILKAQVTKMLALLEK